VCGLLNTVVLIRSEHFFIQLRNRYNFLPALWILQRTVGTKHVAVARLGAQDSSSGNEKGSQWNRTIRSRHFEVRRLLPILVIAASRPLHPIDPIVIVIVQTEKPHSTTPLKSDET
jgi:hypothetical protein